MPVFNLTVDDTCPLIQYAQWWSDSSSLDSLQKDYVNGTFHATDIQGATATLTFNGSAVYIYGAKRPNHDVYAVTLDQTTVTANGNSGDPNSNLFNQLLFSQTSLDSSQHKVVLENQYTTSSASWVDVDYILITAGDGNANTQSEDTTWDDNNPAIVYSANWDSSSNNLSQDYYMQTMHRTNTVNAAAYINFQGNAIAIYGATSGNHGLFSVSMDGQTPLVLNGTAPAFRPQTLLYWSGGLSDGQHTVKITNLDANGQFFDLDKVVVSNWPTPANASSSATSSGATSSHTGTASGDDSSSSSHKTAVGPIVGGVVAGVVGVALIFAIVFFFLRRRARNGLDRIEQARPANGSKTDMAPEPFTIEPFHGRGDEANERSPLSPGMVEHESRTPFSASFSDSRTQNYSRSDFGGQSEASKYIIPFSISQLGQDQQPQPQSQSRPLPQPTTEPQRQLENPHMDFPPPAYEQATASSSSRPAQPPVQAQVASPPDVPNTQPSSEAAASASAPIRPTKS